MVEIETVVEEPKVPPPSDDERNNNSAETGGREETDAERIDTEGWQQLMGDDLLLKVLKPPDSDKAKTIQHQDAALVSFVGRLASDPSEEQGPIFQTATNWWVVIGDKDVVPALEMGIRFTQCGATVAIWSHSKFAFGPGTRTEVLTSNSSVRYEVTVHKAMSMEEKEENNNRLQVCRSKKNIANDIYKYENITSNPHSRDRALHIYKKAAEHLDYMVRQAAANPETETDFDLKEANELLLDCLNNIAAVYLQCKSYHSAKQSCVAVLEQDPHNFKALLRAAKAALLDPASSYEEVDAAIQAASEQCQDSEKLQADVHRLKMDFHRRKQAHRQREKNMYSKMSKATLNQAGKESDTPKEDASQAEQRDEVETDTPKAVSSPRRSVRPFIDALKRLPWAWIVPYVLQLSLPFLTYYYFTKVRKQPPEAPVTGGNDEL